MKTALLFLALTCSLHAEDDPATWDALAQSIRERALGGRYPWHHQIGTTVFWVGELPHRGGSGNLRSAWDPHWIANAPNQNAFYVALPYNDVLDSSHTKPEAATVIPRAKASSEADGLKSGMVGGSPMLNGSMSRLRLELILG